jgi:hypothetical protein
MELDRTGCRTHDPDTGVLTLNYRRVVPAQPLFGWLDGVSVGVPGGPGDRQNASLMVIRTHRPGSPTSSRAPIVWHVLQPVWPTLAQNFWGEDRARGFNGEGRAALKMARDREDAWKAKRPPCVSAGGRCSVPGERPGGQGRGRTADLPIFSRTLVPTELPGLDDACGPDGT